MWWTSVDNDPFSVTVEQIPLEVLHAYCVAQGWNITAETIEQARTVIENMEFTPEALTENLRSALGAMIEITDTMVEKAVRTYFATWDTQDKFSFLTPHSNIVQVKMSMPAMRKALEAVLNGS